MNTTTPDSTNPQLVPIKPISLLDNQESILPSIDTHFNREKIYDVNTSSEIKSEIGNIIYSDTDINAKRTDAQSFIEQALHTTGRVATDFLGGTIQGFGATIEAPIAIYDEIKGQDADFNNGLMELGRSIEKYGKDKLPIYRKNPGQSWDITSSGWWFEGIESAFSTLQFLVPVGAAVKGMGALAKLSKAEQILAGLGKDVEAIKYFSKIGTGAVVARNAENMMESYQVRQEIKQNLLEEWKNDPSTFDKLKDSDIGRELANEGREINETNLSNFIAGKAGWKDYLINSANIAFDALQLVPLFKGFDPITRKSRFATSLGVKEAQEAVAKSGIKYGTLSRVADYLNPTISGIGRSLSEGVEEIINNIGYEEGKADAAYNTGKDDSSFSTRLSKYLTSGDTYEAGFWGTLGGALFEGGAHIGNKAFSSIKGLKSNTESDFRIAEIANRVNIIKEGSEKLASIEKDTKLSTEDKKEYASRIKSDLALDLGLRAAEVGNIELLLNQVKSPEFRKSLIEQGIAKEEDVDKAVAKTTSDIITAETLYKKHYNSFYTAKGSDSIKGKLVEQSVISDFLVQKSKEKTNKLNEEISKLKSEDAYLNSTKDENVENGIQLKALETAKEALEDFLDSTNKSKDEILTVKGKEQLESINSEISRIKELMGDKKPSLNSINPEIISKQAETVFHKSIDSLNNARISDYRDPKTIEKLDKIREENKKKAKDEDIKSFKDTLDKDIKDKKHTIETLEELKKVNKNSKEKVNYINSKLKDLKAEKDKTSRKEEVKKAQEQTPSKPVNVTTKEQPITDEDPYSHIPTFEIQSIDEESLDPRLKGMIDKMISENNLDEMQAVVGDYFLAQNPQELIYARNKFQEARDNLNKVNEIIQMNTPVDTGDINEFEIDEEIQEDIKSSEYTLESLSNEKSVKEGKDTNTLTPLDFYKKVSNGQSTRTFIPQFDETLENFHSNKYFTLKDGDIGVNDSFLEAFKLLMGKELQVNTELDIEVDTKNPFYSQDKNKNLDNVPIKISYKGTTISYLGTIREVTRAMNELRDKGTESSIAKADQLELELTFIKQIRDNFKTNEENKYHNSDKFKTKITYKGNGTLVSRGRNKSTALRSVRNKFEDFYTLELVGSVMDRKRVYNTQNDNDFFDGVSELRPGVIYGMQTSANGTKIPVPLNVSKLDSEAAIKVQKDIDSLLTLLDKGLTIEHQEVKEIRDRIADYIKVDKSSQFNRPVGFRSFAKGKNAEGKATSARIEMSFYNSKGERQVAVIKKDDTGISTFSVVKQVIKKDYSKNYEVVTPENGDIWVKNSDGSTYIGDVLESDFRIILQNKYHNINISKLKSKEEYNFNGKKYKSYKDYLIDEEIIKTDVAQVKDTKGNVVSNLFGFRNDFSLEIDSNLYKEGEKPKVENKKIVDKLVNLLMSNVYEKEFGSGDYNESDLSFRENYSIYKMVSTTADRVLGEILKNPMNSNIKDLAKWYKKQISKNNVTIKLVDRLENGAPAKYSTSDNTIYISKAEKLSESLLQSVVLHEIEHAFTVSTIYNNVTFNSSTDSDDIITDLSQIKFRKYCPQYVKDFITDIVNERNKIADQLSKKYGKSPQWLAKNKADIFYGLENIQEFIAEVRTNPNFRNEIRKLDNDGNFLTRFYNKIIEFLNKVFGSKLSIKETETLKSSSNKIKNFITNTKTFTTDVDVIFYKKRQEKFDNNFSNEEINEIVTTFEGMVLNSMKGKGIDLGEDTIKSNKIDSTIREYLSHYKDNLCPPSCLAKTQLMIDYQETFLKEAIKNINKSAKVITSYDIEDTNDVQEVRKDFDDTKNTQISSQDTVGNQIKRFVRSTPLLNSTKVTYTKDGKSIWDNKKSTVTGMNTFVDFNVIYPYMVRNLLGTRTPSEIITRLQKMATVYPSFAYMVNELSNNANLLAQIESNMGRKFAYDSYVTFLSAFDSGLVVSVSNEAKGTKHEVRLANDWFSKIEAIHDSFIDKEKKKEFIDETGKQFMKISGLRDSFKDNIDEITTLVFDFANTMGVNLSFAAINAQLKEADSWNDFTMFKTLTGVLSDIKEGKRMFGNLNTLATIESLFTFDIVENSVLGIDGKPLYSIRNPHFISNWFDLSKSTTEEGKKEFNNLLKNYSQIPDMQLSNWLWNEYGKDSNGNPVLLKEGFLDYTIIDKKKIAKTNKDGEVIINKAFTKKFSFHNFGGAKETLTREVQKYKDFSETDSMMLNLLNHTIGSKKQGFILVPSIIPSDSGTHHLFEVPKVELKKGEFIKESNRLSHNSMLFKAIRNTVRQEARRIQQATELVFDIVDNKLQVKKDLDINILQQYFHYGKSIIYNEDGTINLYDTLLDKNGKPKGKAFTFQNLSTTTGNKIKTLNEKDILINHHLEVGDFSQSVQDKIDSFIDEFIAEQSKNGIKDYIFLETNLVGKHNNIGDGSFKDLIIEYKLNQYLANVEQFNFFNGNIAEYKDKIDTNKRAKQMFAPGIGLSVEIMKMQLENGSFTNGRNFRGVTIADIYTSAKDLEFMVLACKNNFLIEKNYSNSDIRNFSVDNILNKKPESSLEKDIYKIVKSYLDINSGDAQGYITLDRYEGILKGLGRWNNKFETIFRNIREGKQLTSDEVHSLQPLKGFYYGREFDSTINRYNSNQIKYSTIPLIPQLVAGTDLEKLMNKMNKDAIDEVFFESAHKVGAKRIYKIHNTDSSFNTNLINEIKPSTYFNKNWQLQLDVPEHLVDAENLLATQFAKLIISNVSDNGSYSIGDRKLTGKELKEHYKEILSTNIIESAKRLLEDLGVVKTENGFVVDNEKIQKILIEEIQKRGLSENYETAIEFDEKGRFKLPLFTNNMTYKWEAILTSLFTNKVINQKMPGGSLVLASRIGLDSSIEQSKYTNKGIEWAENKKENKTLKSYRDENGVQVVEVLMGAWSSKLYKNGERVSIDEIPDSIRTMIGYRIPTEKKSSMFVFKVVGFLPEESKGVIITPDNLITQTGWDFDVDKVFTMVREFDVINDKFELSSIGNTKKQIQKLINKRQELRKEENAIKIGDKSEAETKLINDIFGAISSSEEVVDEVQKEINEVEKLIREISNSQFEPKETSLRRERNNELFNIYYSILTDEKHLKEMFTPSGFDNLIDLAKEVNDIFGEGDNNINPMTEEGQRLFRQRNVAGIALKGIAANLNAFGQVAEHTKMSLNDDLAFKFKFKVGEHEIKKPILDKEGKKIGEYIDIYSENDLLKRYKDDITIKNKVAYITLKNLGFAPDNSFLNVDGDLITEKASQGIAAAVDGVKNPVFSAFNATTYTYPSFHTMILAGVPERLAGMFIRQPIIKRLNDYYFENKSLLGDNTGDQIELIKRFYQTQLYTEIIALDKNKKVTDLQKTMARRDKKDDKGKRIVNVNTLDKGYLVYVKREDTESILGYNPDSLEVFSVEDLKNNLINNFEKKMKGQEKIDYLKNQLMILEYFNKAKKAGEAVQDILRVTKVDGLGASPSMMVTDRLVNDIEKLRENDRVLIDGTPAINKIYPLDNSDGDYSVLKNYLEYGNKLSVEVLKPLFIQQSSSYIGTLYEANTLTGQTYDEEQTKGLFKFLSTELIQDFDKFKGLDKNSILGISKEINLNKNLSFNNFKDLSVANKVYLRQQEQSEYLKEHPQHILNFLLPRLEKSNLDKNKYHKIDFVFYKNEQTDDNLADSILKMLESGNEFDKNLAEDLINYTFITSGLTFGLNSFSKTIPSEVLTNYGLGDYLYDAQQLANTGQLFTGKNILDLFFRNHYNNLSYAPVVRTRWHYKTNEEGKRFIIQDEEGFDTTIDNSPNWESSIGIIQVTAKTLKNVSYKIKSSPYILVATNKNETKLYKKYEREQKEEEVINSEDLPVFYYQVNKLGKDGIMEFDSRSIFEENNIDFTESELISKIEDNIFKLNEQKVIDNLNLENTSKEKQEEIIKTCKI